MKIIVYHGLYGCETGCCGHVIETDDRSEFSFSHLRDGEDPRAFAERLVRQKFGDDHVKDLDWERCVIDDGDNC